MAARLSCNIFYQRKSFSFLSHLLKSNHNLIRGFSQTNCKPERICVYNILGVYQDRIGYVQIVNNRRDNLSLEDPIEAHVHHLVLTARPDEFEKLPPKCSSCGAILQTKHITEHGYVPEKKFIDSFKDGVLDKLSCYNCFQLKHYNTQVTQRLLPAEIFSQLKHIRRRKALVLYVVDMFDIEGTMLQNILQLIGKHKRLIIVGNKLDRFPQDDKKSTNQLENMKDVLKELCTRNGLTGNNFRDICLISTKTGFGLQTLIEKINKHRDPGMDVYLVGCSNVGKSTLYNLIHNLLNIHKPTPLSPQAIEHHIPGTTASLLRADISMRRLHRLRKRLITGPWQEDVEFELDSEIYDLVGEKQVPSPLKDLNKKFIEPSNKDLQIKKLEFVNKNDSIKDSKQCYLYDTPGILNPTQIVQYLTPKEIQYLTPTKWIVPRSVLLKPGNCLFIGGLARLDYVDIKRPNLENQEIIEQVTQSAETIYVNVMVSPNIPLHVTISATADEKYEKLFKSNFLELPVGSEERYNEFPRLKPQEYTVIGNNRNINACDLVLHGIGWFSVAAVLESRVHLVLFTPNGEGQGLREKPILPYSVRKKEGRGVPYQGHMNYNMYGHTRKKSPEFVRVFQQQNDAVYSWKKKITQKLKRDRYQLKENKRLKMIEEGVVLGKMRNIREKESKFPELSDEKILELQERH